MRRAERELDGDARAAPVRERAHRARRGAAVAALIGLAFDLLFLAVRELPATVPIALTLAILELGAIVARGRAQR